MNGPMTNFKLGKIQHQEHEAWTQNQNGSIRGWCWLFIGIVLGIGCLAISFL